MFESCRAHDLQQVVSGDRDAMASVSRGGYAVGMRTRLVLVAVAALAFAPAAGANRSPLAPSVPSLIRLSHSITLAGSASKRQQTASCSVRRAHGNAVERKILPVACEQPPRSEVKINLAKQGAANAATALEGP